MLDNIYVRLINNWLHDVATGLWAACMVALLVLDYEAIGMPVEAAAAMIHAGWVVLWMLMGALAVIALTGALRLVYWRKETPAEEMASKRPALIGKHIAFPLVYGAGTYWAWMLVVP